MPQYFCKPKWFS